MQASCATTPYQYTHFHDSTIDGVPSVQIAYGQPNANLDRIAWVVGSPARILPLNSKINNHKSSSETTEKLATYLAKNDLTDVQVYVNHYDPKEQWRQLRSRGRERRDVRFVSNC